jgi:hypothetical protein
MLNFAEFGGKVFLVYCKGSDDSRTLIGVLLLSFRGVFFASIEKIGIFVVRRLIRTLGVA